MTTVADRPGHAEAALPGVLLANGITAARCLLSIPMAEAVFGGARWTATGLAALFAVLDIADGRTARATRGATAFGRHFDSIVDRVFGVAVLASLVLAHRLPLWVGVVVGAALCVQAVCALGYHLSVLSDGAPRTAVGPLLGVTLLTHLWLPASWPHRALDASTAAIAVGGMLLYLGPAVAPYSSRWSSLLAALPARLRLNYTKKLDRAASPTRRLLTVPNIVTAVRIGPLVLGIIALSTNRWVITSCCAVIFLLLDVVDGFVARELNQVTVIGRHLDVSVDKTALVATVVTLVVSGRLAVDVGVVVGFRVAVIGVLGIALTVRNIRPPRNIWSWPANLAAFAALSGVMSVIWLAFILNAANLVHYWSTSLQILKNPVKYSRLSFLEKDDK